MLGDDLKAAALPELDEGVRNQVLEDMIAEVVDFLEGRTVDLKARIRALMA